MDLVAKLRRSRKRYDAAKRQYDEARRERQEAILQAAGAEMSRRKIAAEVGVTYGRVQQIIEKSAQ